MKQSLFVFCGALMSIVIGLQAMEMSEDRDMEFPPLSLSQSTVFSSPKAISQLSNDFDKLLAQAKKVQGNLPKRRKLLGQVIVLGTELRKAKSDEDKKVVPPIKSIYKELPPSEKKLLREEMFDLMAEELSDSELKKTPHEKVKTAAFVKIENDKKLKISKSLAEQLNHKCLLVESDIEVKRKELADLEKKKRDLQLDVQKEKTSQNTLNLSSEYQTFRQTVHRAALIKNLESKSEELELAHDTINTINNKINREEVSAVRKKLRENLAIQEELVKNLTPEVEKLEVEKKKMEKRIDSDSYLPSDYLRSDYHPFKLFL